MDKHKILHITPHLGGGVGRVLLSYLPKVKKTSLSHTGPYVLTMPKKKNVKRESTQQQKLRYLIQK